MEVANTLGGSAAVRSTRVRLASLAVAVMLVAITLFLVQQPADAATASAPVAAAIAGADSVTAQISFSAIVCPILLQVRNTFASSPFFAFIQPIINQFLVLFGCSPSG